MAVIGDVNIVGVGDEVGERGRDWNTDIVGVGTEILEYMYSMLPIQKTRKLLLSLAVLVLNDSF